MMQIYEKSLHLQKTILQMKRFVLFIAALAITLSLGAQTIRPEWEVHFQSSLINDEFDVSKCVLAPSGTLAALRLSPYVGFGFGRHNKIKAGLDIMKNFGAPDVRPVTELAIWYQYNHPRGFTLAAGIFPYSLLKGYYSTLIFSDAGRFYDAHVEGFYLGWEGRKSHYELAFDWNGQFGDVRREQFNVMTSGEGWITSWLALCWEGMFHHYASSAAVQGVVDDHVFHPYVKFEGSSLVPLQRLQVSLGFVAGYQMDRLFQDRRIPLGGDILIDIRKWNFGIRNLFYYGGSQAPFYHATDAAGEEYGSNLYIRSSWWQIRKDGQPGLYDRLDAYWMKSINDYVDLGVHAVFHFDYLGILGFQQLLTAKVNLDGLKFRRR